ncbi:MAG TPA: hypothetical protein VGM56_04010 [Byssovorax sp.]
MRALVAAAALGVAFAAPACGASSIATPEPHPLEQPQPEYEVTSAAPYVPPRPVDTATPPPARRKCPDSRPLCLYQGAVICEPGDDGCPRCFCR